MRIKCLAQGHYCCCRCQQIRTGGLTNESLWSYLLSHNSSSTVAVSMCQIWGLCGSYGAYVALIDLMHWRHVSITTTPCWGSSCAHVLCWQSALALSLSVSARVRASPAVRHAGVGPLAACLAMAHVAVPRLTPNAAGRPSVTSYA